MTKRHTLLPLLSLLALGACDLDPLSPGSHLAAVAIAAGQTHVCRLNDDGAAYCWGFNVVGQIGDGTRANRELPARVSGDLRFRSIFAGAFHTCGVAEDTRLYCWGGNPAGVLGEVGPVLRTLPALAGPAFALQSVVLGDAHTCALDATGRAFCWGDNGSGQLGVHDLEPGCGGGSCSADAVAVVGQITFARLSAGTQHTCGVTDYGAAYCWGGNGGGQLGNGTFVRGTTPVLVAGNLRFHSVHAGGSHTCGIALDGTTYCWGLGVSGQLGTDERPDPDSDCCANRPVRVQTDLRFVTVVGGDLHTCALTTRGQAHCWGENNFGQLGNGAIFAERVPVEVSGRHRFRALTAGTGTTCAATLNGDTYCWGDNFRFQLGNGARGIRSTVPQRVEVPGGP